jgi:outer membrane protein assembly factor BamB
MRAFAARPAQVLPPRDIDLRRKARHVRPPTVVERLMRTPICRRHGATSIVVALLLAGMPDSAAIAQNNPLWHYQASDSIAFFRVTPLGSVLVATSVSLSSVDGTTGATMWVRPDKDLDESNVIPIPASPFALVTWRTGFEVVDLNTGETRWSSRSLPIESSYGHVPVVERRMLLVYGKRSADQSVLVAADLETGAVLWRQDNLFAADPEPLVVRGPYRTRKTMLGHQRPVLDTDTSMVLYVSKDGPVKIDVRMGSLLWRSEGFRGKEPPAPMKGYAAMMYADTILYVPTEDRLTALDLRDGRILWDRPNLKSKPQQLEWTPSGLVVRMPHIDVLDLRTGTSRWPRPFTDLKRSTPFVVRGDKVYVAAHGVFYAINLTDGTAIELSQYKLRETNQPDSLDAVPGGFVLRSAQNLILFDTTGFPAHHLFYPPPKLSTLTRVAFAAAAIAVSRWSYQEAKSEALRTGTPQQYWIVNPILKRRYEASRKVHGHYYVLTVLTDSSARKGPGLVKLNIVTGKEEGRLWLGDRTPEYEVDAIESMVFFKQGKRQIVAFRM